jgi:hypothetical protein
MLLPAENKTEAMARRVSQSRNTTKDIEKAKDLF